MPTLTSLRNEAGTHQSLDELRAELERQQATKRDYVIDTRRMTFRTGEEYGSDLSFDTGDGGVDGGTVTDHAHSQISARLGIPKRYYDRLRGEAPVLLDKNVQHWFAEKPERRMVRMLDDRVRAFVSDRFRRIDNYDLMEHAILPALEGIDGMEFHVASLNPDRMVMRAILPSVQSDLAVGDIVQAGFQFKNSEVGLGKCLVEPFVWRIRCLNGLVMNDSVLQVMHIGRRIDESDTSFRIFQPDTLAADDRALMLQVRDAISAAVENTLFAEVVETMRNAAAGIEIQDPVAATVRLQSTFELSDTERDAVLGSLARGGDMSKWGAVNAVTDAAKRATSFDRQEEMERIGGNLLVMPQDDWALHALGAPVS